EVPVEVSLTVIVPMSNELTVPVRKLFTLMLVILPTVSAMCAPWLARRQIAVRRIAQASDHFLGRLEVAADAQPTRQQRFVRRAPAPRDGEPRLGSHHDDDVGALRLGTARLTAGDFPVVDGLGCGPADEAQMQARFSLGAFERGGQPAQARLDACLFLTDQGSEPREGRARRCFPWPLAALPSHRHLLRIRPPNARDGSEAALVARVPMYRCTSQCAMMLSCSTGAVERPASEVSHGFHREDIRLRTGRWLRSLRGPAVPHSGRRSVPALQAPHLRPQTKGLAANRRAFGPRLALWPTSNLLVAFFE